MSCSFRDRVQHCQINFAHHSCTIEHQNISHDGRIAIPLEQFQSCCGCYPVEMCVDRIINDTELIAV